MSWPIPTVATVPAQAVEVRELGVVQVNNLEGLRVATR
jgi:hypothetical protein